MKKILTFLIVAILCLGLVACVGGECAHTDTDCDGKCDACGSDFGEAGCKDSDADGKCDNCGKVLEVSAGDGVALVSGGKANFQIIVGNDAMLANRDTINSLMAKLNERIDGANFVLKGEKDFVEQDIEILIGSVTTRDAKYKLDRYSYGVKGYGIEVIDTKLVVVGGSDAALEDALKALERDVFGIKAAKDPITSLTVTESIHKPQDDYKIKSVKIGDNDLKSFVFATDSSSQAGELAKKYQQNFYVTLGYRPAIVSLSKLESSQRAIVIQNIENGGEKTTDEGFNVYIAENGNMMIECEFPDRLVATASAVLDAEILNTKRANNGTITIKKDYTYKKNIRIITYEDFGAVGDGITDDFEALRATHEYANKWGHVVHATAGKVYKIGNKTGGKSIPVETDTYWNGAKFIIDDSGIVVHNSCQCNDCKMRQASIFSVKSSTASVSVLNAIRENLPLNSSFDGETITKFENWPLTYDALVHISSNERKVFIRVGGNADDGDSMNEVILVHKDGTIDPSTPITWTYTSMSYAIAYSAEDTPIVIDGGGAIIETIANRPSDNKYIQFARNISVKRSNVKVCNFEHIVQEEQEFRAPYAGIISTSTCHNVTYENIVLQAARRKFVEAGNQQGTYEIGGYAANDIKFINVNASNFFATGDAYDYKSYGVLHEAGQIGNRGMMGTNYCRNFYFDSCRIVNFDSHKGMGNLTIVNCELTSILVMGAGNILIKDTVKYGSSVISYRSDYGASFRGNIAIENVELKYSSEASVSSNPLRILNVSYSGSNDYDTVLNPQTGEYEAGEGSTNYMVTNLSVKGLKVTKYEVAKYIPKNEDGFNDIEEKILTASDPLYIFTRNVSAHTSDISKFAIEGGYSSKNRYIPPVSITIENSYANIVLPSSITFRNTKITVDGVVKQ